MNDNQKLAVAALGGYVAGRLKKGRAAIRLVMWLNSSDKGPIGNGLTQVLKSEEISGLVGQLQGPLRDAVQQAAMRTATTRMSALSGQLTERTQALSATDDLTAGLTDTVKGAGGKLTDTVKGAGSKVGGATKRRKSKPQAEQPEQQPEQTVEQPEQQPEQQPEPDQQDEGEQQPEDEEQGEQQAEGETEEQEAEDDSEDTDASADARAELRKLLEEHPEFRDELSKGGDANE